MPRRSGLARPGRVPSCLRAFKTLPLKGVTLSLLPSEYVKRQLHASFQFEEVGMDLINRFGAGNMLWSSDYPHTDSTWPHSREFIDGHFKGIPGDVTAKIVGANAASLYHLD